MRKVLLALAIVGALVIGSGQVVSADEGGVPAPGSCGAGQEAAHAQQINPAEPGASEFRNHQDVIDACSSRL